MICSIYIVQNLYDKRNDMHHLNMAIKDMKNELKTRLNKMENQQKKQMDSISLLMRQSNEKTPSFLGSQLNNSMNRAIGRRLILQNNNKNEAMERRLDDLLKFNNNNNNNNYDSDGDYYKHNKKGFLSSKYSNFSSKTNKSFQVRRPYRYDNVY
jgi:hypothetical protein